jgi:nitrogen fixation protein NifB
MSTTPQSLVQTSDRQTATLRVAVATKGGGVVNQHFGHASQFEIYDVSSTQAKLVEVRAVNAYCHGKNDEPGDLGEILDILSDCKAVLTSRIGDNPGDRLRQAGIEPVQVYEVIETALFDLHEQWNRT